MFFRGALKTRFVYDTKMPLTVEIPLTTMPTLKLLKSRSNAKVTTSNHLLLL
jgi:hypothetical protein